MNDVATVEDRIAAKIDHSVISNIPVSGQDGLVWANMTQVIEVAKLMSLSQVAVPKHLRNNPGTCLAIVIQSIEWKMSAFAVANKSYSVNDRLAYESQLIQAVILQRAPIKGRFAIAFDGEGAQRRCKVTAELREGGKVDYTSPPIGKIPIQNSPLWKNDPDQQLFYYSGRALCRRHFPDVLLGVYAKDELEDTPFEAACQPSKTTKSITSTLDELAAKPRAGEVPHDPVTGEIKLNDEQRAQLAAQQAQSDIDKAIGLPQRSQTVAGRFSSDELLLKALLDARNKARLGGRAFTIWLSKLSIPEHSRLEGHMEELRALATKADEARQ